MAAGVSLDSHVPADFRRRAMERDVREGLTGPRKSLPPVWFYDETGSLIFDEITRLVEYYPTRAEREILDRFSQEIALSTDVDTLVEIGGGTSEKTFLLLEALSATGRLRRFIPFDVSEEVMAAAAEKVAVAFGIDVRAVVGDFHHHLDAIPADGRRLFAFMGGTIGNLTPSERSRFLTDLDCRMDFRDRLLLGTDLVKDPARLVAAYDDAAGVTARFNRNVLAVLNHELGADFELDAFTHVAVWDEENRWIEMHLRSERDQRVVFRDIALEIDFTAGEEILTEISAKFTPDGLRQELWDAGFVVEQTWTDEAGDFMVSLSRPYC